MVTLRSHDQGFVAAPPGEVYRLVATPATYPSWWPGSRLKGEDLSIPLARPEAIAERERDGIGVHLVFGEESLEWYLEPFDDGTIVNAFLEVRAHGSERRATRGLDRKRGFVRGALVGLKKKLEATP